MTVAKLSDGANVSVPSPKFHRSAQPYRGQHLLSALALVLAYVWLLIDPMVSALVAWLVSMTMRQARHFFFEPHDYDEVNQATHQYKEAIKVGYNLRRKLVLMGICAA